MGMFFQHLINGVSLGLLYGISAMGLILVYRSSRLLNFAHGAIMALGAFLFVALCARAGWPVVIAFSVTLTCCFVLGIVLEKYFVRPLKPGINGHFNILMTLGLALMLNALIPFLFQKNIASIETLAADALLFEWDQLHFTTFHAVALTAGIIVLVLYWVFFVLSSQGISMRAFSENAPAARALGIPVKRVLALSWGISALLCALTGILLGLKNGLAVDSLSTASLKVFPVVILGGMNSIAGALLGGMIVGMIEAFLNPYVASSLQNIIPYFLLLVMIVVKPSGFFGRKALKKGW